MNVLDELLDGALQGCQLRGQEALVLVATRDQKPGFATDVNLKQKNSSQYIFKHTQ